MKKVLSLVLVVFLVVIAWSFLGGQSSKPSEKSGESASSSAPPSDASGEAQPGTESKQKDSLRTEMINDIQNGPKSRESEDGEDSDGLTNEDDRPATQIYKTADDAIKAIQKGAVDYDDIILEQFTELGDECTWCDSFYKWVKESMMSPETKQDQRSYYAEVLAISGRVENIKALAEAVKAAPNSDEAELYAEALELTVGKDEIARYLGSELNTTNETLKEAVVAAITNQGSRLAVDTLYKYTVEKGDPDGFYSIGIGLGELVPEPEALPFLQEIVMKRDQYSHLAVKSLLNSGLDGLKIVFDVLSNSKNPEFDREMIKGAAEHVNYEEEVVSYLTQIKDTSKDPVAVEFAKSVLDEFALEEAEASTDQDLEEDE